MPAAPWTIRRIQSATPSLVDGLADLLLDCVAGGASVGFLDPLPRERAITFWERVADGVSANRRVLLVAEDEEGICGTVQLVFATPDNQPHRADVAKMLVHSRARRRGLGEALLRACEDTAVECGKWLLVLDTVTESDASRLYRRLGWTEVGEIPDYALYPDGRLCSTTVFYRKLR